MSVFFLKKEGRDIQPRPIGVEVALVLLRLWLISWRFGSIGCTTTLALAGVLPLATVVTGLAAALTFAVSFGPYKHAFQFCPSCRRHSCSLL